MDFQSHCEMQREICIFQIESINEIKFKKINIQPSTTA